MAIIAGSLLSTIYEDGFSFIIIGKFLFAILFTSLLSILDSDIFTGISVLFVTIIISFLSIISGDRSIFIIPSNVFLSTFINDSHLSSITGCILFIIFGSSFLSPISDCSFISAISNSSSFSSITSIGSFTSIISGGILLLLITSDSFLSFVTSGISLSTSSSALFLSSALSYIYHFSLLSLTIPFAGLIILITKKRLFNKVFIKQRYFTSI